MTPNKKKIKELLHSPDIECRKLAANILRLYTKNLSQNKVHSYFKIRAKYKNRKLVSIRKIKVSHKIFINHLDIILDIGVDKILGKRNLRKHKYERKN